MYFSDTQTVLCRSSYDQSRSVATQKCNGNGDSPVVESELYQYKYFIVLEGMLYFVVLCCVV